MTDYRVRSSTGTISWEGRSLKRAKEELALARHTDARAVIQFYDVGSADDPGDWFKYRGETGLRDNPISALGWLISGVIVAGGVYLLTRESPKPPVTVSPAAIPPRVTVSPKSLKGPPSTWLP